VRAALVDASALVALFDEADKRFEHYKAMFAALLAKRIRLATTWPCVTEASYLLSPKSHMAMLTWLAKGPLAVQDFNLADVEWMLGWMAKYTAPRQGQMDFADASLFWLATQLDSPIVLTTDLRDFGRYRLPDGRAFEIL
jgi:uncharacterized protein